MTNYQWEMSGRMPASFQSFNICIFVGIQGLFFGFVWNCPNSWFAWAKLLNDQHFKTGIHWEPNWWPTYISCKDKSRFPRQLKEKLLSISFEMVGSQEIQKYTFKHTYTIIYPIDPHSIPILIHVYLCWCAFTGWPGVAQPPHSWPAQDPRRISTNYVQVPQGLGN